LVEIWARLYVRGSPQWLMFNDMRPAPYVMFASNDPEQEAPLPPGYRIFLTGSSTLGGAGATLPRALQSEFARLGVKNAVVRSYGVGAQVSGQELAQIVFQMADEKPDAVVMYGGGTDFFLPLIADPRPGYPFNFIVQEANPLYQQPEDSPALWVLAYESQALRIFAHRFLFKRLLPLEKARRAAGHDTDEWRERIAKTYVRNVEKASVVARAFGAEFLAFLEPAVHYRTAPTEKERGIAYERGEWGRQMVACRELVRREAAARGLKDWVDLSDMFEGVPDQVFSSHTKMNPRGTVLAGKRLARELLERLPTKRTKEGVLFEKK
jgi:hypothetical protein